MVRKGGNLCSLADCNMTKKKVISILLHRITLLWSIVLLYFLYKEADKTGIFVTT